VRGDSQIEADRGVAVPGTGRRSVGRSLGTGGSARPVRSLQSALLAAVCLSGLAPASAAYAAVPELGFFWVSPRQVATSEADATVEVCVTVVDAVDPETVAVIWIHRGSDPVAAASRRFGRARFVCAQLEIPQSEHIGVYRASVAFRSDSHESGAVDPCALGFACEIHGVAEAPPERPGSGSWVQIPFEVETRLPSCIPDAPAVPREGRVAVVLGDGTLLLDGGERVRPVGVRFPQAHVTGWFAEKAVQRTRDFMRQTLDRRKVWVYPDARLGPVDSEGRLLGYVVLADGEVLNSLLLEEGLAVAAASTPYCFRLAYRDLQETARRTRRGLWATDAFLSKPRGSIRAFEVLRR